jgi:hypothetical protein
MDKRSVVLSAAVAFVIVVVWAAQTLAADCGEPVSASKFQLGDKWTWRDDKANESIWEVIGFEGDLAQVKWANPKSEPDKDGILFIDVDRVIQKARRPSGEVVTQQGVGAYTAVGEKTLDFPLQVSKKWERQFMSQPRGGSLREYYGRYKVLACEEISTPAGKFSALKIEVETGPTTGARPGFTSGTYYLWYAPQVKVVVKRQYVPSRYWYDARDSELIKFEAK